MIEGIITVSALAIFFFFILKIYLNFNSNYWKRRGVVALKIELSVFQLLSLQNTTIDVDQLYYDRLGEKEYGGLFEFGTPTLFVKGLDVIKQIMVKEFDRFTDHRDFVTTDPLMSKSLFFLRSSEWREMRNFLSPTFTTGKIKRMFSHFELSSHKFRDFVQNHCPAVENGFEITVTEAMGRFTADVIGAVAFVMETDALTNSDSFFFNMVNNTLSRKWLFRFKLFGYFPRIGSFFKMQTTEKVRRQFYVSVLTKALRQRELNPNDGREDFLQILTEAMMENANNMNLSMDVAVQQAFLFFIAGFDTVASSLGTTAYLLALHPEAQQKLWKEIDEAMVYGKMSYETVNELEYLDMVIQESLRMFPPVQRVERKCTQEYPMPGANFTIPVGMVVSVPVERIHYDPKYYPNPEKFDPERFSAANNSNRNQSAYLPFGIGPRNCIGMRLAIVELKVALSYLIFNFQLAPIKDVTPVPIKMERNFGFTRLSLTLKLKLEPRNVKVYTQQGRRNSYMS